MTENVIYDTHNDNNNNNDNKKHAYAGTNDYFTHLRALFGTPSTAAFWPTQLALLGIIPPAVIHIIIVTQGWVVNGVRRHGEPLGDNDPPQLCVFLYTCCIFKHSHLNSTPIRV